MNTYYNEEYNKATRYPHFRKGPVTKLSIRNLIGILLVLAQLVIVFGCQPPTVTEISQTPTTSTTPAASPQIDLIGVWSGTHVESITPTTWVYDATLDLTEQKGDTVIGTLVLTFIPPDNSFSAGQNMSFIGKLSGSTLQGPMPGMTYQVSGNSMTGHGISTAGDGPMAYTWEWSWNLTRER